VTTSRSGDTLRPPLWSVVAASVWALLYAVYRIYYALGGTVGLIGRPVSESRLQAINAVGAAIILIAAALPWLVLRSDRFRRITPVLGWIVTVGCCMHALVDATLRGLSFTGVHPTRLPSSVWASYDRRSADLQDLFLNEPWFLVQGLLWAALTWSVVRRARRRTWLVSAILATVALTVVGVLSGLDVLGSLTIL
jgi:hypothetical protein